MTGTTLYVVNRLLPAWEEHGLVNSRRESKMIIDVRALRKLLEDNYWAIWQLLRGYVKFPVLPD